jgi:sodium/proline symporter
MQQILGSQRSDKALSGYGKIVTIIIGIVAIAFAIPEAQFIFYFVLFAWSGLGAAFGPVVICLLYYKKTTRAGVLSGMLTGFLTSIVWVLEFKNQAYGLYEAVPGFAVGIVVTMLVSMATHKPTADNL